MEKNTGQVKKSWIIGSVALCCERQFNRASGLRPQATIVIKRIMGRTLNVLKCLLDCNCFVSATADGEWRLVSRVSRHIRDS
jgi:hypothetical protein